MSAFLFGLVGCRAIIKNERGFRENRFLGYWYGPESNFLNRAADKSSSNKSAGNVDMKFAHAETSAAARRVIADEYQRETMRLNNLAVAYTRLTRLNKARDAFRACLKRKPLVVRPYFNFAEFQRLLGRPERARGIFAELAARKDIKPRVLLAAGEASRVEGAPELGVMLVKAMHTAELVPLKSALWLGRYYQSLPDYARASKWLDRALKLDAKHTDALYGIGAIAHLAGDHERAVRYLEPALKYGGKQPPLRRILARSLYRRGEIDKAVRVLNDAPAQVMNTDFELLKLRGRLLLLKDWRAAPERLLQGVKSPEMRKRLMRTWFGDARPEDLKKTRREFELMY